MPGVTEGGWEVTGKYSEGLRVFLKTQHCGRCVLIHTPRSLPAPIPGLPPAALEPSSLEVSDPAVLAATMSQMDSKGLPFTVSGKVRRRTVPMGGRGGRRHSALGAGGAFTMCMWDAAPHKTALWLIPPVTAQRPARAHDSLIRHSARLVGVQERRRRLSETPAK